MGLFLPRRMTASGRKQLLVNCFVRLGDNLALGGITPIQKLAIAA